MHHHPDAHFLLSILYPVDETRDSVKEYYGETLQTSDDLKTNACCTGAKPASYVQQLISNLHPDTIARYYGCGLCLPERDLNGKAILDLGCGAGRDVYIASQMVGATGRVVGVDMTEQQLEAAESKQDYHADAFGFANTAFHQGYLETLSEIPALKEAEQFDVIISNCVLNLCTDKKAVLDHCYRLLKPGGEFYFSDVYASRRVPEPLQKDPVLYGECLSGALYWNDFENLAIASGFSDPRLVEDAPITIENAQLSEKVEGIEFYSATYRLWKLPEKLEPACEDYGQAVIYKGTLPRHPIKWTLDKGHVFETGRIHPVCGNTWYMLEAAAKEHFDFVGNFDTHYGIFEGCGDTLPYSTGSADSSGGKGEASGNSCC